MLDRKHDTERRNCGDSGVDVVDAVRVACARDLAPLVQKIDKEGLYPESVMRELGRLGAFAHHLPDKSDSVTLGTAINAMAAAGEYCLSTSFCIWCQDALTWYIFASDNEALKTDVGRPRGSRRRTWRYSALESDEKLLRYRAFAFEG